VKFARIPCASGILANSTTPPLRVEEALVYQKLAQKSDLVHNLTAKKESSE
jgi:hypothetical protein